MNETESMGATDRIMSLSSNLANVLREKDNKGINPKRIFNTSKAADEQIENFTTLVGDVRPTYGVRVKKKVVDVLSSLKKPVENEGTQSGLTEVYLTKDGEQRVF